MNTKRHQTERAKKIAHWKPHIIARRSSGTGITAYCRVHGLSVHKFKYWQNQINKNKPSDQVNPEPSITASTQFVEITQAQQTQSLSILSSQCEIKTQHGFSIIFVIHYQYNT